jgi:hypothetical protein
MTDVETAVCAFKYPVDSNGLESCSDYNLVTYSSRKEAEMDGATVTHDGSCGLCSTTQDLAIYLSNCSLISYFALLI